MIAPGPKSYSADVDITLILGARKYPLAQLGPSFAILSQAESIEASTGEIELRVDDTVTRWAIKLDDGIQPSNRRFQFTPVG